MNLVQKQDELNMREPLEGQLLKFTNVVKGWQYRWFSLDPAAGTLEYHIVEEINKQRPRGAVYLAGAVVSPSDEDSQTFFVFSAAGDVYKLKACDAKERQFWITRLRAVAEMHTQNIAEEHPPLPDGDLNTPITMTISRREAFNSVKKRLQQASIQQQDLSCLIDKVPLRTVSTKFCNLDLLLLKSTSNALLLNLEQCFSILQKYQPGSDLSTNTMSSCLSTESVHSAYVQESSLPEPISNPEKNYNSLHINHLKAYEGSGEVLDPNLSTCQPTNPNPTTNEFVLEEYKTSVLPVLSSLRLGADLTQLRLPIQAQSAVSLLEYWASCLSHPVFLLKINEADTSMDKMIAVVKWYLAILCSDWKDEVICKPLNPFVGETFHCSWKVPQEGSPELILVTFLAEQVSRHPPVSAIYLECPKKKIALEANITISSRFLGMSLSIVLDGKLKLSLGEPQERYEASFPSVAVHSLVTSPKAELTGRVSLSSPTSGFTAHISFHPSSFSGNIHHKLMGEIKNPDGHICCKLSGDWHTQVDFSQLDENNQSIHSSTLDISALKKQPKYVRPVEQQDGSESRCLWNSVLKSLHARDFSTAEHNREKLESYHRSLAQERSDNNNPYSGKLFRKQDNFWTYKYPL